MFEKPSVTTCKFNHKLVVARSGRDTMKMQPSRIEVIINQNIDAIRVSYSFGSSEEAEAEDYLITDWIGENNTGQGGKFKDVVFHDNEFITKTTCGYNEKNYLCQLEITTNLRTVRFSGNNTLKNQGYQIFSYDFDVNSESAIAIVGFQGEYQDKQIIHLGPLYLYDFGGQEGIRIEGAEDYGSENQIDFGGAEV